MPEVEVFGYEVGDILAAAHLLVDGAADAVGVEAGPFVDLVAEVTEHLEVRDGGKAALEGVVEVVQEDDEGVQVEFLLGEVDGQAEVLGLDDEVAQADEGMRVSLSIQDMESCRSNRPRLTESTVSTQLWMVR